MKFSLLSGSDENENFGGPEVKMPEITVADHKGDVDPFGCEYCSPLWEAFIDAVLQNYPHLVIQFETVLAGCGILALPKPWRPVTIMLEGPSGAAKSTVLNVLLGATSKEVQQKLYRSDKFTPAAFVSAAANVKKADLKK